MKIPFSKFLFFLLIKIFFFEELSIGQPWLYDFGSGTGTFDSVSKVSKIFLPLPCTKGDTARVRTGTGGGSFILNNPGINGFGTGSELKGVASSNLSVNKFSIYKHTEGKTFYIKFSVRLDGGTSGKWMFFQGNGACFYDNNGFVTNEVFCGIQWLFSATGGGISACYRDGYNWDTLNPASFSQAINYKIEIYCNNNSSGTINYKYNNCSSQSVAAGKWDLWVNGILLGNDLPKAALPADSNINSFMFYGISSTSNVADIYIDDILYLNSIPASIYEPSLQPTNPTFSNVTSTGFDLSFEPAGGNPNGYLVIRKAGSFPTFTPADDTDYTAGTTVGDGVVAYTGQATTFSDTALGPVTVYYYKIFSYNGASSCINYNISSPLQCSIATPSINFYSKASGALESTSSWGKNTDGSGASPAGFTYDGQYFYIKNRSSAIIAGTWTVSGNKSKIIIGDNSSTTEFTVPSAYVCSGKIDIKNHGKLTIQNTTAPAFDSVDTGSTVEYSSTGSQQIISAPYYNLIISGNGNKSMAENITVNGTVTVSGVGTFSLNHDLTTNNMVINVGTVEILANKTLTVTNTFTNNAGISNLIIRSGAQGSGSLINNNSNIKATVERFTNLTTYPKYCYLSSPVSNAKVSSIQDSTLGNFNCYAYDPSLTGNINQKWKRMFSNDTMITGKGYIIAFKSTIATSKKILFTGILNAGDVTTSLSTVSGDWNLIGNPYPCAISANNFITENAVSNPGINGTLYFWTDDSSGGSGYSTADYASWNGTGSISNGQLPNGYIGTGQAFFVQSRGLYSSITFNNTMKSNNNEQFFISDHPDIQRFWLSIMDNYKNYNEILIGFLPDATEGFDPLFDGIKLKGNPSLSLYSLNENDTNEYSIQGLPPFQEIKIVAIGIDAILGGTYFFRLKNKQNFAGQKIFLQDNLLDKTIDLDIDSSYEFTTKPGILKNRFVLKFINGNSNKIPESNENTGDLLKIYSVGKSVFVENLSEKKLMEIINVYDLYGRKITEISFLQRNSINNFTLNVTPGIYIVTVKSGGYFNKTKVFIR